MRHVCYLHGFASSAKSTKAAFLADRLRAHGLALHCPDFNEPEFESVTTTRMLGQLDEALAALAPGPVTLIGSSLGGFVAYHAAYRQAVRRGRKSLSARPIDRLVLLAPAFEFGRTPFGGIGDKEMTRWRDTGLHEFFHHAENRMRPVRYALYEDAQRYDSAGCVVDTPALVFQGRRDTVVDPAMVQRFAATRPAMTVRMVDDDHQLGASLDFMWREIAAFLGLCG
jgi:pimeloyl-ACP methyl ester carboxylesterase